MDKKKTKVNEPVNDFIDLQKLKSITFFNSLNEMEDFDRLKMARMTGEERMEKLEQMRNFFYKEYLNPDGTWPPLDRVIRIIYKSK